MDFESVADALSGIPNSMTPRKGWFVYDHLRRERARDVLELGTAHAVSAAYMAAAVEENGGRVTTVDHVVATRMRDPAPEETLERAGVDHLVERVLVEDSSYTWWLKNEVVRHSDADGNCEPQYDFCFLDGAHNFTIDGLAVVLVEKLLRPGAWLLLDDLTWRYDSEDVTFGPGQGPDALGLSAAERSEPHVAAVFDAVLRPHPSFADFRVENDNWLWAHKVPGAASRGVEVVRAAPPMSVRLRESFRALRRRL